MTPELSQDEIIAFLMRPETYGLREEIHRIDTHASVVFLAGGRVYKLKRAVKFPYLDFSTLDLRRASCAREVSVNRRTAAEIYLGTVPVTRRADGTLSLGGGGTPVEWLVEMRRFDDAHLLSRVAERDELTPALAARAAEAIARFHREAEVTRDFGGARGLLETIDGNGASFEALPPDMFDRAEIDTFQRLSRSAAERLSALLDRRAAAGCVRHCHGDLHLANMCVIDGVPTLFDAIEFNDTISNIDTLYDFAFFVMDMIFRGLAEPANAAFNRYAEIIDDIEGLAAWPLFLATRAAIRAHVSAAAALRGSDAGDARRARDYLALAGKLLAPTKPLLVAVGGLSGSGKSTLARALAPAIGAASGALVLRSDVLRKSLAGVDALSRLPPAAYTPERSQEVYAAVTDRARRALAVGQTVVVDAVAAHPAERAACEAVAAEAGVPFVGLWLEAPDAVLRARVAARRHDASDATPAVVDRQLTYRIGPLAWRRVDAGQPTASLRELALAEIRRATLEA